MIIFYSTYEFLNYFLDEMKNNCLFIPTCVHFLTNNVVGLFLLVQLKNCPSRFSIFIVPADNFGEFSTPRSETIIVTRGNMAKTQQFWIMEKKRSSGFVVFLKLLLMGYFRLGKF